MRRVTYAMSASLDGYIVGPDGSFDWGAPGRGDLPLLDRPDPRGRRPPAGTSALRDDAVLGDRRPGSVARRHRARLDRGLEPAPKVVFSNTLSEVQGTARLASGGLAEEIERLYEPEDGGIAIGGATLAAEAAELGLIDEYRVMVYPVLVGGIPFFPNASAGWISNSSRPAPSARGWSIRATGWSARSVRVGSPALRIAVQDA